MTLHDFRPSRRAFIAGSGLVIGLALAPKGFAAMATQGVPAGGAPDLQALNAFVKIGADDTVTILSKHIEFGQGPFTGLATLVAEELDADWSQMRAVHSPADDTIYANLAFGLQGTGGSTAIANSYEQMRKAGATAKAMLVAAAAREWAVPAAEITVQKGRIQHAASGKESGFGAFADKAAAETPPENPVLKDPATFTLVGTDRPKLDTVAKSNGTAVFTLDVLADGMLYASVAHPAHFGATVASFDAAEALAVPGVVDVKQIPQGVAVFAENTFAALKGRQALRIEWNLDKAETRSSRQIEADYVKLYEEEGFEAAKTGNVDEAFAKDGAVSLEADLVFPFLAHAPMEPLDAVFVPADDGSVDLYNGAQFPGQDKAAVAEVLGLDPARVRVNTQLGGGSFGRRAQFGSPFIREAAEVFKASGAKRPVKFMWTREDDIRGGFYRPMYAHRMKASVDQDGRITGWRQSIVGQSIMAKAELDETSVEGAANPPYDIPNLHVVSHNTVLPVPALWWRSVGHTHTGFAVETFVDELLERVGKDPVEGRMAMLGKEPRHRGTLKTVAEMAKWGEPVPEGRMRGVAVVKSFGTYVAQIVEVSALDGAPRVHKVWVAVDCGTAINPNVIRAQMEGGVGYGLGAVLFNEVTLGEGGRIVQSNFHDYRSLRINEMPEVIVEIVPSDEPPTGVGEPGVPPVGPAVANAWRRLTGAPVRRLPIVPVVVS
ncbi:twin-arginine translocation pathway signal protein [Aureimonas sp. Leaf454]|uniref:xanthine dehydrogenase family protein molybdopterin-binding subunit n=1 Tax=Aureimonas sp. Leaf454 TaxID=1736381 RepID=UPI0006F34348|nr:xanthine dehydrogenase family protein molybdopterin-binding subunit [Aureimonas sp. Leaf454]KQT54836.1 twin-arginine translocation pathway signal protein [Aureimonas sp. Leaf454]